LTGNLTSQVLTHYLYAIPAFVVGMLVGSRLDQRIDGGRFRAIVIVVILGLGLVLLLRPV
jgi:uncharacterized membrane protein YfcA